GQARAGLAGSTVAAAVRLAPVEMHDPARETPATLEQFLAAVSARAFRFAELGLRHREDALDAVQDATAKVLAYLARPPGEWSPVFWAVLRSRIIDLQRRRSFRLKWLSDARDEDGGEIDWADESTPAPARAHDGREAWARLAGALREL